MIVGLPFPCDGLTGAGHGILRVELKVLHLDDHVFGPRGVVVPLGHGLPDGKAGAGAPCATFNWEPIMPSTVWVRTWQCMC